MKFEHEQLPNGLSIIGEVNNNAKSAAVGFFVKTGSRDETAEINGVSHFLEHMMFKGTDKLNAFEVNQAFDSTGAQFNAFTSEENTVYYAAVLPEYLIEITRLWAQLMRPALRIEDFDIEKNVIKEEIAMYKDMPSFDVADRCRSLHFDGHPCGNSVLGSVESIDGLAAEQMRQYFANRYAPNNMVLACAGNFDFKELCSTAAEMCQLWEKQQVARTTEHYAGSKEKKREQKSNLNREHICLMSTGLALQDTRRYAAYLLANIIGDDVGSRLFWELVDKALAETATMHFAPMDNTGSFFSYIRCSNENYDKVMSTIDGLFDSLFSHGVTEDELRKAKNKVLSALVVKNELPMGRLVELGFNWIYLQQYNTIEEDVEAIKAVTVSHINSLVKELNPGDYTLFSMGPG